MKRTNSTTIFLSEGEKDLISKKAESMGKEIPGFMRDIVIAFCQNRLSYTSNTEFREEFSKNQNESLKMLSDLQQQLKDFKDLYEIDLRENINSISQLNVDIEMSDIDKVLRALQNIPLFLDQICDSTKLTPKFVIKILCDLYKENKVDQLQDMKWRLK